MKEIKSENFNLADLTVASTVLAKVEEGDHSFIDEYSENELKKILISFLVTNKINDEVLYQVGGWEIDVTVKEVWPKDFLNTFEEFRTAKEKFADNKADFIWEVEDMSAYFEDFEGVSEYIGEDKLVLVTWTMQLDDLVELDYLIFR